MKGRLTCIGVAACLPLWVAGCAQGPGAIELAESPQAPPVPERAEDVRPLREGQPAPGGAVRTPEGEVVSLDRLYAEGPTMLIFYRGGWCPYCNTHLGQIAEAEPKLREKGVRVLAISPDRPEKLKEATADQELSYQLLSDSRMAVARAFGTAFRVDDATVERYQGFGIDLGASSGEDHQLLPVPAVYLIDRGGTIRFAYWDSDYRERLGPERLLAAAEAMLAEPAREPQRTPHRAPRRGRY